MCFPDVHCPFYTFSVILKTGTWPHHALGTNSVNSARQALQKGLSRFSVDGVSQVTPTHRALALFQHVSQGLSLLHCNKIPGETEAVLSRVNETKFRDCQQAPTTTKCLVGPINVEKSKT